MLRIARRHGQSILIDLDDGVDPSTPVGELFREAPIVVKVYDHCSDVRLGIKADKRFRVMRAELNDRDEWVPPLERAK